ncbi:MAG TPA: cysteine hydrolase, partial [Candidatus Latescibacteria bacterium]|nr:cysteine hydrolase [Candidatus Latescibacterota bacterium]
GAEVVQELAPQDGDLVIPKVSYSGFFRTDLEDRLRELGVEKLIITGCVTNICVLYTAVDALMRGYEVEVPEDCVAALDEEDGRFALKQIREVLKPRR